MAAGALDRRPNVRRFAFDTSVDWSTPGSAWSFEDPAVGSFAGS